ncbi:DUF3667 domain-containing protein [Mucilaginibacter segetis]|uniref:DUF3667 domain-containing protein n=1 Tax=Mucilaginibacter segetis TaxID=2793071 RepID=A0A934PX71_9SPHI|nr:DUF3667 domain-containing protein [Mucilaginibacter segetis]MBK0381106.1 DUF3667 domain-containing protein [Mucilaginibacter segetis]
MKKHYRHENDCLNCGTILEGKFCHNCGQENLQMKESFGHMVNHAVSDYFHFDDQFFKTLSPLLLKPGKLTIEYLAGRRARYLHPVKMYIFISLIFFLLYFQSNHEVVNINNKKNEHVADSVKNKISENIEKNKDLTPAQKKAITKNITGLIPDTAKGEVNIKENGDVDVSGEDHSEANFSLFNDNDDPKTYQEYLASQKKLPSEKKDNFLEKYIKKKGYDWKSHGKNSLEMFREAFKHNVPKMMFILLPLFALILKIAFWKNRKFYVEHIIYSIHLHCFLFLFLGIILIINMIIPDSWDNVMDWIQILSFIIICWYVYRSLRVVYHRSRWRTISKMIGVSMMYMFLFGICFVLLALITAITVV